MSRVSSNARSKAYAIEVLGWENTEVTERFNPHGKGFGVRQDLFGFIDLLALTGGRLVAIQACVGSDAKAHREKVEAEPRAYVWLASGQVLELWIWRKIKVKRGGKQVVWSVRRERAVAAGAERPEIKWEVL